MTTAIHSRLKALEALDAKRQSPKDIERATKFRAAVSAFFDAMGDGAPRVLGKPSADERMKALAVRLDTNTATADDQAMLDGLPKCHVDPETLVMACVDLTYPPGASARQIAR